MFYSTTSHGEKIFHAQECSYSKRIKRKNQIYFYKAEDARAAGYRQCNCCSRIGKQFRSERKEILQYASQHHIKMLLEDGVLYIDTILASWKIVTFGNCRNMHLYHANREPFRFVKTDENGKTIHTYHVQKDAETRHTILEYLVYINAHDDWRISQLTKEERKRKIPNTKRAKKEEKARKAAAKRKAVCNVLNIIERLEHMRKQSERVM